ncbi:MAG: hypothetical protein GX862_07455 [Leucobacter sp.]|nr:hypothetical protein [Leucobacter sp.]
MSSAAGNTTKASSVAALERASNKKWAEWLQLFADAKATELSHPQIARIALAAMPPSLDNPEWWAQAAAIAFEQHAGMRVPGQSLSGEFRVGASKTVPFERDEALARWVSNAGAAADHLGHAVFQVRESRTEKRSFWRASLEGAGKLEVAAESKGDTRAQITIQHTGLNEAEQIETWRAHWRQSLSRISG